MFLPSQKTKAAWDNHAALAFSFEAVIFVCTLTDLMLAALHGTQLSYTGYYSGGSFVLDMYEGALPLVTLCLIIFNLLIYAGSTLKPVYTLVVTIIMSLLWFTQSAAWISCDMIGVMSLGPICSQASLYAGGWTSYSLLLPVDAISLETYFQNNTGFNQQYSVTSVSEPVKFGKVAIAVVIVFMYVSYATATLVIVLRQRKKLRRPSVHTCTGCLERQKMLESDSTNFLCDSPAAAKHGGMETGAARSNGHTSRGIAYADSMSYEPSIIPQTTPRAFSTHGPSSTLGDHNEVSYEISAADETESRPELEEGYAPSMSSRTFSIDTHKTRFTNMTTTSTVVGSDSSRKHTIKRKNVAAQGERAAEADPFAADGDEVCTPTAPLNGDSNAAPRA